MVDVLLRLRRKRPKSKICQISLFIGLIIIISWYNIATKKWINSYNDSAFFNFDRVAKESSASLDPPDDLRKGKNDNKGNQSENSNHDEKYSILGAKYDNEGVGKKSYDGLGKNDYDHNEANNADEGEAKENIDNKEKENGDEEDNDKKTEEEEEDDDDDNDGNGDENDDDYDQESEKDHVDGQKDERTNGDSFNMEEKTFQNPKNHEYLPLKCESLGGPTDDVSSEMVYWMDIPSDAAYRNEFQILHSKGEEKFATFEPDIGGWNNMRMSMETVLTLAISMGRTLVLPPEHNIYLMGKRDKKQKYHFTFKDFYNLDAIQSEHIGVKFIPMTEFLERVAMGGKLKNRQTGEVFYPPSNRTDWNIVNRRELNALWQYLRDAAYDYTCDPTDSIAYFPKTSNFTMSTKQHIEEIFQEEVGTTVHQFIDNPTDVDAPVHIRLREHMAKRDKLCFYDEIMQDSPNIHFRADENIRFLAPFSVFAFFEDWRQATWTKRFIRDHIRYSDEIVCAAASVVDAVRQKATQHDPIGNSEGSFDTLHIRRNDFSSQYAHVVVSCKELYENSKEGLKPNSTIFIATDERNRDFFAPFIDNYNVLFLSDFQHLLAGINTNYFGFVDQLVASRGNIFYGTYLSTFTSYINRMRGYYSVRDRLKGFENGELQSFYFNPPRVQHVMTRYNPINKPFWSKEFAVSWRDIDKGIGELSNSSELVPR